MRNERTLDALDREILAELANDARLSNTELARRVGLTAAPCLRRVQRLERDGVIRGYHARVDERLAGRGFEVIVDVDLSRNDRETIEAFEAAVIAVPEIIEARRMLGQPDYYLRVQVVDTEDYERLTLDTLSRLPAVRRLLSHQTMRLIKGS
ncbi:Lrp/AsnC family transcriptional regulator [Pseudoclavibacter endophyticus]|uniref:Lrp/AsnC family transcriptional regulator n=1 Tax=Pseudoclavibacter endophyticus TaxID=1778590 RepID=A0A6H9WMD7_9MICO|nr:Lrp/AsnC family transcriptional regulator [Pseudoclavibacter endophyticus]KAB1650343.1 Lrp/AsnC family transcriptional regulator [Pseudoclavibacter endophyticus]